MKRTLAAVLAALILLIFPLQTAAEAFTDVSAGKWYTAAVTEMAESGYLTGYQDGSFRPNGVITYAEFITLVKRCATGSAENSTGGHWAQGSIDYAYSSGWYDYDELNSTMYNSAIPRYMAAKLIALGLNLPENEHDGNVYWQYMQSIKDFDNISGRYAYLVIRCYNNGILQGDNNGNFNPDSSLTRAEACVLISRALKYVSGGEITPSEPDDSDSSGDAASVRRGGVSENGALQVIGTQLCNSAGEPIQLRGFSSHGLQWYPQFTTRAAIATTADYGANLFRIAMYTGEDGYISQPETVKKQLIAAVDAAIAEDMYVIIDWHILSDGNPMTYVTQAKAFFAEISKKYSGVPNVIYEICNEPNGSVSWAKDIKPYAEQVIPVIRQNSPDAIVLVGSGTWSQDVNDPADDPLSFKNIMYTCHFYAGTHGSWLRDRIDYALSKGAPIFISEWGTSAADGSGGVYLTEAQEWMVFLNARGISWANWSLCDKNESSAALLPGSPTSGWTQSNLSASGKFVVGELAK